MIQKSLRLVGRENRGRLVLLILMAVVAGGFEVLGAGMVYVLVTLIASPTEEVALPIIGDLREHFHAPPESLLLGLSATMAAFLLIRALVHIGQVYVENRSVHEIGARLAKRLVLGYLLMPYVFHLKRPSYDLIRNAHQAVVELVSQVFGPMIRAAAEAIMVLGMLFLLVGLAPAETGLAVLILGGAALLLAVIVQPRLKRLGRLAHDMNRETLRKLQQSLFGIRDIKILGRERASAEDYGKARTRMARAAYLRSTATELPRTVIETALVGFILLLFTVSILRGEGTQSSLSVLGLFAYAGLRLQPSLNVIISGLNNLRYGSAPIEALHADLVETEKVLAEESLRSTRAFEHELRLERVSYQYETVSQNALSEVSLTIHPGEFIGICGPTGGGKTTLVDVVTGLLQPIQGRVTIDDVDLREDIRGWQRNLGVVPQTVFLTDDTLRANIALGVPKSEVDVDLLEEAIDLAQLREFITSLPHGLDTIVGERGVRISGGERQRVAIARALYRRPTVLILDEGTSALDNTTEKNLLSALEELRGGHTILMIAHRLTTIREADQIVFINDGRISGLGSHEYLAAKHPQYRSFLATEIR